MGEIHLPFFVYQQISNLLKVGGHISTSLLKLVKIFPLGVMDEGSCSC